jgi:hypothetical protein
MIFHNHFSAHPPDIKQPKTFHNTKLNWNNESDLICPLIQIHLKNTSTYKSKFIFNLADSIPRLWPLLKELKELISETALLSGLPVVVSAFSKNTK